MRRRVLDTVGDRLEFSHDWIRRVADDRLLPATRPTSTPPSAMRWKSSTTDGWTTWRTSSATTTHGRATSERRFPIWSGLPSWQRSGMRSKRPRGRSSTHSQRSSSYRRRSKNAHAIERRFMSASARCTRCSGQPTPGRRTTGAASSSGRQQARRIPRRERVSTAELAEAPTRFRGAFKTPPSEQEVIGYIDAGLALLGTEGDSIEKARLLMARACLPNLSERRDEAELRRAIESGAGKRCRSCVRWALRAMSPRSSMPWGAATRMSATFRPLSRATSLGASCANRSTTGPSSST